MILYDFDGMFDKRLADYISKNKNKYGEEQWEEIIPKLYEKFGNTVIKAVGKAPNEYYADFTDASLIKTLSAHLKKGVPVSEFLRREIELRNLKSKLVPLLDGTDAEVDFAISLLGTEAFAAEKYMQLICNPNSSTERKNALAELLKEIADTVKPLALRNYSGGAEKEYMLEILSRCRIRDESVFKILVNEFINGENIPMHAAYLAAYGDERAIKYLYEKIEDEDISFVEFTELKYAIEALGGEYEKERDFSSDRYYGLIKEQAAATLDKLSSTKK